MFEIMVVRSSKEYFKVLKLSNKNLSTYKISKMLDIPQPTISTWISGKQKPREIPVLRSEVVKKGRRVWKKTLVCH